MQDYELHICTDGVELVIADIPTKKKELQGSFFDNIGDIKTGEAWHSLYREYYSYVCLACLEKMTKEYPIAGPVPSYYGATWSAKHQTFYFSKEWLDSPEGKREK